jgi:hypothetical protein
MFCKKGNNSTLIWYKLLVYGNQIVLYKLCIYTECAHVLMFNLHPQTLLSNAPYFFDWRFWLPLLRSNCVSKHFMNIQDTSAFIL